MTWLLARGVALCAVLLAPLTAPQAQTRATPPADWQAENQQVVDLVRAGRNAEAVERARAASALCPQETAARTICLTLLQENTAWAQARAGQFTEAEAGYRAALAAREQVFQANDPIIGDSAAALGFFLVDRQRWDDAAPQLERAVEILGRAGTDRAPTLAAAYARLEDAYRAQGRMTAAVTTAREALDTLTRRVGPETPQTLIARANLATLLRDAGQAAEALDIALAALRAETLPLDLRVRFTIDATSAAVQLGRTEAVRPAFETTLALASGWAETGEASQRQGLVQLLQAGGELALTRGDPDTALDLARRAQAVLAAEGGKPDARASAALVLQARALLGLGQPEQAATLLAEAGGREASLPPTQAVWMVRALMEAGRTEEADKRLKALQASLAGGAEAQSGFTAGLQQLSAQLAERRGDRRAALAAIEQAVAMLPAPGPGTANAAQAATVRREAIRLRALLGDFGATAADLNALLQAQAAAQLPLSSLLETRLLLGWFFVETRQTEPLRTQIAAVEAALPELGAQSPRGAATMLTRLAELSLAIPGPAGAGAAMGYLDRARLGMERTGISARDAARMAMLRGRTLARLDRHADALAECRAAEEKLEAEKPAGGPAGAEQSWRDAVTCIARAELALGQFAQAGGSAARLLEQISADQRVDRAEAMRLLAAAQAGQGETEAADATLRAALALVADASPRRAGLRAELWGDISANLHRAGRDREARNAAVAQRQIGAEDNAGIVLTAQSLRQEATALLALGKLEEAIAALDRGERLRASLLRVDPGLLLENDTLLAQVELARGRFAEAATAADRVISAYRAQSAPSRTGLATILETRAGVDLALGAFIAAETAQREALDLRLAAAAGAAVLPAELSLSRLGLARIIDQRGDTTAAGAERKAALDGLARARGATHPSVVLARLDEVAALRRAGPPGTKAEALAKALALVDACDAAFATDDEGRIAACQTARAQLAAQGGNMAGARAAATAALATMRQRGDAGNPALVAPLLALAEAGLALDDAAAARAALEQLAPLQEHAQIGQRIQAELLRARLALLDGAHAEAAARARAGLAILAPGMPRSFADDLLQLTQALSDALLAEGRGMVAAAEWRVAIARLNYWDDRTGRRGVAQRGLGAALLATADTAAAWQAWQQAARWEADGKEGGAGPGSPAHLASVAGAVRAALATGRITEARAEADMLAGFFTPGAALLLARLRAEIAEEAGDNVSALLEWWRVAGLAGEDGADPELAALSLLRTARLSLATGQRGRAEDLLAQATKLLAARPAPAGSEAALALLEVTALLRAQADDLATAQAAATAWRDAVLRAHGPASPEALAPELAMAALEQRANDNAEAAARISAALGLAERLRGRDSRLWARIALQAADAAARIGDDARAKALREEAGKVLAQAAQRS